jgi:serine/threonine protein kinase
MPLEPGARFGPYVISGHLGAGGMGDVYKARDTRLNRDVALKLLPPTGDRSRFQAEARALAALNHPNIVAIYDVGDDYLITELIDGAPLKPAGVRQAVELAAQVADGLAAAHSVGITHRDLKPANILVTREGRAKVIDFGLVKHTVAEEDATLTQAGTVMGTASYMSPEQVRGETADARSDLFSLGIVLYEAVSGQRPFQRDTAMLTMAAIVEKEPEELPDSVPVGLKQIIYRLLAKDREQRFQTARDLAFALRSLGASSASQPSLPHATSAKKSIPWFWLAAPMIAGMLLGASVVQSLSQ